MLERSNPNSIILDITNASHRSFTASKMVETGRGIAMQVHQYGAMYSADNENAFWLTSSMLKKREGQMAPVIETADMVINLVDQSRIDQVFLTKFLGHPEKFSKMFAGTCMLRFPVRKDATFNGILLHPGIVSQTSDGPVMQVFYPGETHLPVQKLTEDIYRAGIKVPVITSLNKPKVKTPSTIQGVLEVAKEAQLSPVILEPKRWFMSPNESYPIIVLDKNGIHVERDGNLSSQDLRAVGWPIDAKINDPLRYVLFQALWKSNPQACFNLLIGNRFFHNPKI